MPSFGFNSDQHGNSPFMGSLQGSGKLEPVGSNHAIAMVAIRHSPLAIYIHLNECHSKLIVGRDRRHNQTCDTLTNRCL